MSIIQRSQIRAARAILAWSQERLAEASGVSLPTIKRLEPGEGAPATTVETLDKIVRALQAGGIEFTNGGQPGVRLSATAAALAAASDYVLRNSDAIAYGKNRPTPAEKSELVEKVKAAGTALLRASNYREFEAYLARLRDCGFSIPNDLVSRVAHAFPDVAQPGNAVEKSR